MGRDVTTNSLGGDICAWDQCSFAILPYCCDSFLEHVSASINVHLSDLYLLGHVFVCIVNVWSNILWESNRIIVMIVYNNTDL